MKIKVKVLLKSAWKMLVPTLLSFFFVFPQWGYFGNTGYSYFQIVFSLRKGSRYWMTQGDTQPHNPGAHLARLVKQDEAMSCPWRAGPTGQAWEAPSATQASWAGRLSLPSLGPPPRTGPRRPEGQALLGPPPLILCASSRTCQLTSGCEEMKVLILVFF